ncbi:CDP-glucose 4,6-dehydratase [Labrys miyagiensis]|uniref:CDP-glucose 4,6-dehydratase n=1 Tax=Labrys miyagiensis TaxID=346912 RepID=A0ABQ6CF31_9HYPH|nr:CDP-glucose 4,6-dehydratase [Labrys miyagiensis]GLS18941.1 CDP-glucose 4,6-dehydratase [Labrys miyagiensis]
MSGVLPKAEFWRGRKVLLTGHTGFKGSWAALWLHRLGAEVTGFALPPEADQPLFETAGVERSIRSVFGDLRDLAAVKCVVDEARPDVVLHLAAQALVRRSLADPIETFASNVMGTAHLLEALRGSEGLRGILAVTSDKVYLNEEKGTAFLESDKLGGKDPYSASKAASEIVAYSYARSFFDKAGVPLATARGGNVIGGGDHSANRLVPDIVRAVRSGRTLELRHPEATRPWQHVLDCVNGYLVYAEMLVDRPDTPHALNFGPDPNHPLPVAAVADAVFAALGREPDWMHKPVPGSIEMKALTVDSNEARRVLGWQDLLAGPPSLEWTAQWYAAEAAGQDMRAFTLDQISRFSTL